MFQKKNSPAHRRGKLCPKISLGISKSLNIGLKGTFEKLIIHIQ